MLGQEEEKEKEEERSMMNKIENFKFGFFKLVKSYWNFWSRFNIRILMGSSLKLFEPLYFIFLGVIPISYV